MEYIRIAKIKDFAEKNIKSFTILGKKVGIIKKGDERFFATEVGCKHQNADLTKGKIKGMIVTCHRHNWQYDLESGKCLNNESPDLRKHGLYLDGEDIYVSLLPIP